MYYMINFTHNGKDFHQEVFTTKKAMKEYEQEHIKDQVRYYAISEFTGEEFTIRLQLGYYKDIQFH